MTTLTDQIDHFVRWFFNSSPDVDAIEPRLQHTPRPQVGIPKPPLSPAGRNVAKRKPKQAMRRPPGAIGTRHEGRVGA